MTSASRVVEGRFAVDTDGLRDQMKAREPWRLVQELVSNAFDEPTCTKVEVKVRFYGGALNNCTVSVKDDGQGFERIQDIYTLFGYSKKTQDVGQRGRFNLGEKQFFAVCTEGYIETAGRRITFKEDKRIDEVRETKGTLIAADLPFTENQTKEIIKMLGRVIVPENKVMLLNGEEVRHRTSLRGFPDVLPTLIPSKSNPRVLTEVDRETQIALYDVAEGEKSWLYEMGIPVQAINTLWHVDVGQKVPLSPNRDTVRESYLKTLYASLLNHALHLIPGEKMGNDFVTIGLRGATAEVAKSVLSTRFESDNIYLKGRDHRANEQALESGALIGERVFDFETKQHLLDLGVVDYSSDVFPTTLAASKRIYDLTNEMSWFAKVVKVIARDTIEKDISVIFVDSPESSSVAQYGSSTMTFNVGHSSVGKSWFEKWTAENLGTVIHELAHDKEIANGFAHLEMSFVREIERIAGEIAIKGLSHYLKVAEVPQKFWAEQI